MLGGVLTNTVVPCAHTVFVGVDVGEGEWGAPGNHGAMTVFSSSFVRCFDQHSGYVCPHSGSVCC